MKFRHTTSSGDDKIELQMTPMIDIVFQLLVFFIMTFKIVAQEGDFNIRMPLASEGGAPDESQMPPYKLYLTANQDGTL
ncbi:MAG: biopolymer transporter ExbD, partial [Pirellulaceae bacterium]